MSSDGRSHCPLAVEPQDCALSSACASSGKRINSIGYFLRTGCLFSFLEAQRFSCCFKFLIF